MQTEESRALVLDYLRAQERGDGERMLEILADDVCWTPPASVGLGAPRGSQNVLQAMGEAGPRFFDLASMKSDVLWIAADGDKVIVRIHMEAKAASGRDYSNEYVWVYQCADGKIVDIEEHTDSRRFTEIVLD